MRKIYVTLQQMGIKKKPFESAFIKSGSFKNLDIKRVFCYLTLLLFLTSSHVCSCVILMPSVINLNINSHEN